MRRQKIKGAVDVKVYYLKDLHKAWHKSMKRRHIDCNWDRVWFI